LLEHPLGRGLATADVTGDRFGATHVTADNLFLKYGVELGFPGLVLLIAILLGVGLYARRLARATDAPPPVWHFGIWVLAATVGILINGMSTTMLTSQFISYLYLWLGGAVVTIAHTYRVQRAARA
jgi:O-antigen ligase